MDSRTKGKGLTILLVLALAAVTIATSARAQTTTGRRADVVTKSGATGASSDRTLGLMLGVHTVGAQGLTLTSEDFGSPLETNNGAGAGVMIGYGFNRTFSSFVSLDVAKQRTGADIDPAGTFGLVHLEIGARAYLPLGTNTLPYVVGSFGQRGLGAKVTDVDSGESADVAIHGKMFGLGAGLEHFFSPNMSLDAGVHLGFGAFDRITVDGDEESLSASGTTSLRLRIGVTWRP